MKRNDMFEVELVVILPNGTRYVQPARAGWNSLPAAAETIAYTLQETLRWSEGVEDD
jgi:hypothetical protein